MGRAALDNARRYAPGPVVAQAERLAEEAVAARSTGRRPAPDGGRARRNLSGQGHAAADLALAAASEALRTLRKGRR
ncbi:glycosyltransferase family 4 protein [Streptomyces hirsutus]